MTYINWICSDQKVVSLVIDLQKKQEKKRLTNNAIQSLVNLVKLSDRFPVNHHKPKNNLWIFSLF